MAESAKWYVAHTYSGYENAVKTAIEKFVANRHLEDMILDLLEELDTDGKGAPREELERRAEAEGISSIELEEVSNTLMDKGLVYEPNLRYLKRI